MPRTTKNCKQGNNSTHTATPSGAKTVSESTAYYSKGRFINLKGKYNKALREQAELRASHFQTLKAKDKIIREREAEIAALQKRYDLEASMRNSLGVCVDALLVSMKAMNQYCDHLSKANR